MLGKVEGKRRSGWQRMRWLDSIIESKNVNLSKLWKIVKDRDVLPSLGSQRIGPDLATKQQ